MERKIKCGECGHDIILDFEEETPEELQKLENFKDQSLGSVIICQNPNCRVKLWLPITKLSKMPPADSAP
jgi:hypothetical protein